MAADFKSAVYTDSTTTPRHSFSPRLAVGLLRAHVV